MLRIVDQNGMSPGSGVPIGCIPLAIGPATKPQPVLPAHLGPLRTRLRHRHLEQTVRPLGVTFGDDTVAAAMIDRLVHHAEVTSLKGDSYRLKDRDLGKPPTDNTD